MDFMHAFLLAVIQGLTEFLPISSSAHLVLLPILLQWQDQGLVVDIAAHFGSLIAVLFYFRKDAMNLLNAWFGSFNKTEKTAKQLQSSRKAWLLFYASLPILIIALLVQAYVMQYVRNAVVIGIASIVFALLLWWADKRGTQTRDIHELSFFQAILIGFAQAFALIPGASRSGVTMTAGMWMGLTRVETARFSFLLAIPTILAASTYGSYRALTQNTLIDWGLGITVVLISAITAWLCIHWFIKFVSKIGMLPFVIYRIFLGTVLLIIYL